MRMEGELRVVAATEARRGVLRAGYKEVDR